MKASEIAFLPATEAAALIRRHELSPVELLDAAASQYELVDPLVNAMVTPDYERAREAAQAAERQAASGAELGPLHGLPIGIKDLTLTAGLKTTFGSPLYADNVPEQDSLVVTRLKAAGGIVVGKTNTPEFGFGINTRNAVFGTTSNPWNTDLTCGGSSGGSAVALATGMCTLADGSDHGGSLRTPAAFCNVVGFRCSPGRVPQWPTPWVYDTFAVPGPMGRTVRDVALMLSVMAGPDPRAPLSIGEPGEGFADAASGDVKGWRVAWAPDLGGLLRVDPEVARATETAARRFADLGCRVEEASPDVGIAREIIPLLRTLRTAVVRQPQLDRLDRIANQPLKDYLARAERLTVAEVARAEWQRSQLVDRCHQFMAEYRLLLLPGTQMAPFSKELGYPTEVGGRPTTEALDASLATYAISMTNLPAMSIPCGFTSDGLPIGLQVVGGWRREADVLRAAAAFEDAFPWSHHRAPVLQPVA